MHFSKYKLFLFLVFFSILSHFLFRVLVDYTEKTSFIWFTIAQREFLPKEYDVAILGDSQLMSGVHPKILENLLTESSNPKTILYYPRPSEQPEGIYKSLLKFEKEKIKFKTLIVNISPVTTSKNVIVDSHKTLSLNFQPFSTQILFEKNLNQFYLKNIAGNIYYIFLQLFPILKLNGNFSNELRLIPGSDGISHTNQIRSFLDVKFFGNLFSNKEKNEFLKKSLWKEGFYFEWGEFSNFTGECVERKEPLSLPTGIEAAFLLPRKEAIQSWIKLGEYAREHQFQIYFLYAPFSKEAEERIGSQNPNSPIQQSLLELSQRFGKESILRIESSVFLASDFKDYTHLNVCGMIKLTKELAKRL